jgi:hypothetical protein
VRKGDNLRAIRIPKVTDPFFNTDPLNVTAVDDPYSEGFYILFTGLQPSVVVATISISFTYEFIPSQAYTIICP